MEDDFSRETEPSAALDPPSRKPPTAVGTAEAPGSDPGQPGRRGQAVAIKRAQAIPNWFGKWISKALDVVDVLADAASEALRLRG